ncbi:hypothetical protein GALL_403130 [mine drainage metagenome]|uniref:Uncharacterized protein n=1 Tax=mine drainage metagenome TaxID=410659 RepID=A0A1J5Q3V0_9ZZZZ
MAVTMPALKSTVKLSSIGVVRDGELATIFLSDISPLGTG